MTGVSGDPKMHAKAKRRVILGWPLPCPGLGVWYIEFCFFGAGWGAGWNPAL